jgi:membrane protein
MTRKEFITVVKATWNEFGRDDVGNMAAALTYYAFFSLFPLIILAVTISSLLMGEDQARILIYDNIARILPGSSEFLSDAIETALGNRGANAGIFAAVGVITLLWSALGAFDALDKAINRAWKTEKYPSFFMSKLIGFGMMGVLAALVVASLIITAGLAAGRQIANNLIGHVPGEEVLWQIANFATTLTIIFVVFVLTYRALPRVDVTYRDVWLGALLAAIAWALVKEGFAYYLGSSFANYDAVYGTLGAVVALLTWIYLSSLIILAGAEFTAETARVRRLSALAAVKLAEANEKDEKKGRSSPWLPEH